MAGRWRPAAGRRVVSSGFGITLIVAGVFELVLSLLLRVAREGRARSYAKVTKAGRRAM